MCQFFVMYSILRNKLTRLNNAAAGPTTMVGDWRVLILLNLKEYHVNFKEGVIFVRIMYYLLL